MLIFNSQKTPQKLVFDLKNNTLCTFFKIVSLFYGFADFYFDQVRCWKDCDVYFLNMLDLLSKSFELARWRLWKIVEKSCINIEHTHSPCFYILR